MFNIILFAISIIGSFAIGFTVGRFFGAKDASAAARANISPAAIDRCEDAISAAVRTNAEAAEIIQKLRDMLSSSTDSTLNGDSSK